MADYSRIQNAMAKIKRGEKVRIAVLGGSITTGYASNPIKEKSWAVLTADWFKELAEKYGAELFFENEGVSGTDSAFAAARLQNHILDKDFDLMILEFAMNDQWLQKEVRQRSYEGIIRRILNNSNTAILSLFVNERKEPFPSQQYEQQVICNHYGIPFVSWKDNLLSEGRSGDFEKYFDGAEEIHPNNAGHASIASYIIAGFKKIFEDIPLEIPEISRAIPEALTDTGFEFPTYFHKDNIKPLINTGWEAESPVHSEWVEHGSARKGWQTDKAGAELVFEVEGSSVGITYCESDQFTDAFAWIKTADGKETKKVKLECYSEMRKGYLGWAYRELISGREIKKYTVHVAMPEKPANGRFANITGILVTGRTKS